MAVCAANAHASGHHTHATFVAPSWTKMSCTWRQASMNLAGVWTQGALYLPSISQKNLMKTLPPRAFTASARWRIMSSYFPDKIASVSVPFQEIIGIRPFCRSHGSRQVGNGVVHG